MKKIKLLVILLLSFLYTGAQDLSGAWHGILKQKEGGVRSDYYFSMNIRKAAEAKYFGTTYVQYLDKPDVYGVMKFTAIYVDYTFVFKESEILRQHEDIGMYWCIKRGILRFSQSADSLELSGKWESWKPKNCSPGTLSIKKAKPKQETIVADISNEKTDNDNTVKPKADYAEKQEIKREMKKRKTKPISERPVNISETDFYIEVYDHGFVDNDTISLFFNDELILAEYCLQKEHKRIDLKYNHSRSNNTLLLHAHNLGISAPNSAAILIFSGDKVQKVSLLSDLKESGIIRIKYKP